MVVKSDKAVTGPHCRGTKVVCNGKKRNGKQNLRCKGCKKQFQTEYVYKGCVPENKSLVLRMLCRGSGIRDTAAVTGVSPSTVLTLLIVPVLYTYIHALGERSKAFFSPKAAASEPGAA